MGKVGVFATIVGPRFKTVISVTANVTSLGVEISVGNTVSLLFQRPLLLHHPFLETLASVSTG
jgi:hypothetical protein